MNNTLRKIDFISVAIVLICEIIPLLLIKSPALEMKHIGLITFVLINIILIVIALVLKKDNRKEIVIGLSIVFLFFALQYASALAAIVTATISKTVNTDTQFFLVYLNGTIVYYDIFFFVVIIVAIILARKKVCKDIKDFFSKPFMNIFKLITYFILFYIITIVVNIVLTLLFPANIGIESENQMLIEQMIASINGIGLFIMIVGIGPMIEELVFRHAVIKKIFSWMNKYIAAILASLLFAFIHVGFQEFDNASQFIYIFMQYLPMSLLFSFVYVREENILYSLGLHFMNNIFAYIIIVLFLTFGVA